LQNRPADPLANTHNAARRGEVVHEKIAHYDVADMIEVSPDELKHTVESQHGGTATLVQSVPVTETMKRRTESDGMTVMQEQTVWEGVVHVFDLAGHATAKRAYAWSSPIEGSTKRRFYAVLHTGSITGPLEAVRAAIVAENRGSTK
jgi:hypothetical protein